MLFIHILGFLICCSLGLKPPFVVASAGAGGKVTARSTQGSDLPRTLKPTPVAHRQVVLCKIIKFLSKLYSFNINILCLCFCIIFKAYMVESTFYIQLTMIYCPDIRLRQFTVLSRLSAPARQHALSDIINHLLSCIDIKTGILAAICTKLVKTNNYINAMTYIKYIYTILYIQMHLPI